MVIRQNLILIAQVRYDRDSMGNVYINGILSSLRNRPEFDSIKESPELQGIKTSLFDLADIAHAEGLDMQNDGNGMNRQIKAYYNAVEKTVWKIAFREEVSEKAREKVLEYIQQHLDAIQTILNEEPNNQEALVNYRIFDTFRLLMQPHINTAKAEALSETVPPEKQGYEAQQVETEFIFVPYKTKYIMQDLRDKDRIKLEHLQQFYAAVAADIELFEEEKTQDIKWIKQKTAIFAAMNFYNTKKQSIEDDLSSKEILVALHPDGSINVGWEVTSKMSKDTLLYQFTLANNASDQQDLFHHYMNVEQIGMIRDEITKVHITLSKLINHDTTFIDSIQAADADAIEAIIALARYLDLYRSYLASKDEITDADASEGAVLDAMANEVWTAIGIEKGHNEMHLMD